MPADLTPRCAVITGASRGLGAGLAAALAAEGFILALCARHEPALPAGARGITAALDVAEPGALDRFCGGAAAPTGTIDLWVNNAGLIGPMGPLADDDPGAVLAMVAVNVGGVLLGSRAYARHVRGRPGGGLLVNVTSGAAATVYEGWAPYCASKAAVDMATRVVAREEAGHGLRAVALAPGVVETDMQATIRSTPPDRFPAVDRFARIHREGSATPPARVAGHILELLGADGVPEVVQRVPDGPG